MTRRAYPAGVLLAVAFGAALGWAFTPTLGLVVVDASGRELMRSTEPVTMRYLHSVARTPVEEDFAPTSDGVRVRETRFASSGAGLPSQPEWQGTFVGPNGGTFAIRDMDAVLPRVIFRVGYVSEQTLRTDGRDVRLDTLVAEGSTVTLSAEQRPRLTWWIH